MSAPIKEVQVSTPADLPTALAGNFVVANLGSGADSDYNLPTRFLRSMTLIEIDAGPKSKTRGKYYAKYTSPSVISGEAGMGKFRRHRFPYCSSLLPPKEELIHRYGLEKYYEVLEICDVKCAALPDLIRGWDLNSVDFLKTDLEGVDYQVIKSMGGMLDSVLVLQCELRFEPFYVGEPFFHEVASYLYANEFELIRISPEYWKPKTSRRKQHVDGRLVYADCVFMRRTDSIDRFPKQVRELARVKQIVISAMLGIRDYGEFLFELYRPSLPAVWASDLNTLTRPGRTKSIASSLWAIPTALYHKVGLAVKSPGLDLDYIVKKL